MRKKVTLSLVALTSVSMAAYADADVTSVISSSGWETSGSGRLSVNEGVFTSVNGTDMVQEIGELVPGTYKLSVGTLENAKLYVNGKEVDNGGTFTLDETTTVTITVKAVNAAAYFSAGPFSLILDFNFQEAYNYLLQTLTNATAPLDGITESLQENATVKELKSRASTIGAELDKIKDAGVNDQKEDLVGSFAAYDVYKRYQLWKDNGKGYETCSLVTDISELAGEVATVSTGLNKFAGLITEQTAVSNKLKNLPATTDEEKSNKAYAESKYKSELATILENINTNIKNVSTLTDAEIEKFNKETSERLGEISKGIEEAVEDDKAYNTVEKKIKDALAKAQVAVIEIKKACDAEAEATGNTENIYKDLYDKAQAEVNEKNGWLQNIREATYKDKEGNIKTKLNGTATDHDQAKETQEDNEQTIIDYEAAIASIQADYVKKAQDLKAAYKKADKEVETIENNLNTEKNLITGAGLTGDELTKLIDAADKAVTALRDAVEEHNKTNVPVEKETDIITFYASEDYKKLKDAAEAAYTALETAAAEGVANYKAYLEIQEEVKKLNDNGVAVSGLQVDFDKAKKTVNAYESKKADNKYADYKVKDKYTGVEKSIQDAIDAYLAGAKEAYEKGTAVDYKKQQAEKVYGEGTDAVTGTVTKITADITKYQKDAKDVLDNYVKVAPSITDYKNAYAELVSVVKVTSVTFEKDGVQTSYRAEMAAINAKITALENTFTNAQAKTDKEHYDLMMTLATDATILTDIKDLKDNYDTRKAAYDQQSTKDAAWTLYKRATNAINDLREKIETEIDRIVDKGDLDGTYDEYCEDKAKKSDTGLSQEKLAEALNELLTKLDGIESGYNTWNLDLADESTKENINSGNASTIMGKMNEVVDDVAKLETSYNTCVTNDNAAITKVQNEKQAKTETERTIGKTSDHYLGTSIYAVINNAEKQHTDAGAKDYSDITDEKYGKSTDYTNDYTDLTAKLTAIETLITNLRNDEKLYDAMDASFEYGGKTYDKGVRDLLADYKALANSLLQQAKNEKYSWTEYMNRIDYYTTVTSFDYYGYDFIEGVDGALTQAEADIKSVTIDNAEGQAYYLALLKTSETPKNYTKQYAELVANIKKAYDDYKAKPTDDKDMKAYFEEVTASYETTTDNLVGEITALAGQAEDNEKAYQGSLEDWTADTNTGKRVNGLVQISDDVRDYWTTVNGIITNADESTKKAENLQKLRDLQNQLNALDVKALNDYKVGLADDNRETLEGEYETIRAAIKAIEEWKNNNYNEQIATDNLNAYKAFLDEITEAEKYYNEVKDNIGKITNTSTTIKDAAQGVLDANGGLDDYSEIFRDMREAVRTKYLNTTSPTVFDEYPYDLDGDGTNETATTVADHKTAIESLYNTLLDAAFGVAQTELTNAINNKQNVLDAATREVERNGIKLTVVEDGKTVTINDAFDELQKVLDDIEAGLVVTPKVDKLNYITSSDEWIDILNGFTERIEAAKETAAVNDWNLLKTKVDAIILEELADIDEFIAKGYITEDAKTTYTEAKDKYYDDGDATTEEDAVTRAEKAIAAGTLYDVNIETGKLELQEIKDLVTKFQDENGYSGAANESAYNDFMADIKAFEDSKYAELQAYAEGYFIHDSYESVLNNIKNGIQKLKDQAAAWKTFGRADEQYANENNAIKKGMELIATGTGIISSTQSSLLNGVFTISYAKTMLDGYENTALAGVVRTLDALNDELKPADKKAERNDYDDVIDGFTTKLADIAANTEEGYDKHAAYIALEKEVAKVQEELEALKDAQTVAKAETELTTALAPVKTKSTDVEAALNECNVNVVNAFTEELQGLNAELSNIESNIASNKADGTLLFYKDNLAKDIKNADAALDALKKEFENAQKPYTAHDAKYAELSEDLTAIKTRFETLQTTLEGYREEVRTYDWVVNQISNINKNLEKATNTLDTRAAAAAEGGDATKLLTASDNDESVFGYVNNLAAITNSVDLFEKNITYGQYYLEILDNVDGLYKLLSNARALINANGYKFAPEKDAEIKAEYTRIRSLIAYLETYNSDAYTGSVLRDIDGEYVKEDATWLSVDYMKDAAELIRTRIETLKSDIENYKNSIEENSYVLGDLTGDKEVYANDYMKLLSIILEEEEAPEEGSLIAYGGDINGDGLFNIGDLTALVQIMKGVYTPQNRANACMAPTVMNDAIAFEAVGEGANQRIAIRLNNTQAYVGCQMDIKLPAGLTLEGESVGDRAEAHSLSSNDLANGMHRIVLSSLDNVEFTDGEALVYLDVLVGHSYNGAGIEVSNILFTDANARAYKFNDLKGNEATGINTVTFGEAVKGKVYSVGGKLMNGMKRGINIIRGNDGSTKKVIVK